MWKLVRHQYVIAFHSAMSLSCYAQVAYLLSNSNPTQKRSSKMTELSIYFTGNAADVFVLDDGIFHNKGLTKNKKRMRSNDENVLFRY